MVVGRKSGGQIVVDRNTWNLGWMQAGSNHLSWQASPSEAGALCPYFHLLETFTWQLCFQAIPRSLTGQWCMSEVHRAWKIKPEGPGDSFGPSQFTRQFHLPHFNPPKIMRLKLLWYFTCLEVLPMCFSSPFFLTASLLHASATPTSGEVFPSQLTCIIFCGLSGCRRPLSPKPRNLYPAVVPTYTRSFHNICHSKCSTTFQSTPQMSRALWTLHSCSIFCHCPGHQAVPGNPVT